MKRLPVRLVLDRSELEVAIDRLELDKSEPGAMPPAEARQLDAAGRARLIEYLRGEPVPSEQLKRAAAMGMSGGEVTREVLF